MCVCHAQSLQSCSLQLYGLYLPGSSAHGIFQARILEPVVMPYSRESSQSRHQTLVSCISCISCILSVQFSSVQSLSSVQLFVTPWTAACQASLSISNSQSFLKLVFIESMMPSNLLSLCRYFLLLPSIFPSIRVLSNESVLHIRWPELEFQIHQSFK